MLSERPAEYHGFRLSHFSVYDRPYITLSQPHLGRGKCMPGSWRSASAILRTKDTDHEIDAVKVKFILTLLNTKNKLIWPMIIVPSNSVAFMWRVWIHRRKGEKASLLC